MILGGILEHEPDLIVSVHFLVEIVNGGEKEIGKALFFKKTAGSSVRCLIIKGCLFVLSCESGRLHRTQSDFNRESRDW